jgi:hypothetical protein
MAGKLCSDQDVFRKMIDVRLRTCGDGHANPTAIMEIVHQYCREQLSSCLIKHQQLLAKNTHLSFLGIAELVSNASNTICKRKNGPIKRPAKADSEESESDVERAISTELSSTSSRSSFE